MRFVDRGGRGAFQGDTALLPEAGVETLDDAASAKLGANFLFEGDHAGKGEPQGPV